MNKYKDMKELILKTIQMIPEKDRPFFIRNLIADIVIKNSLNCGTCEKMPHEEWCPRKIEGDFI